MAVRNVQGLRAVAALLVVGAHIGGASGVEAKLFGTNAFWINLEEIGRTGVDLFFVISGFIMIVTTTEARHGPVGARVFLWRRMTRIYPPYLVITAAIFVVYQARPDLVNVSQSAEPDLVASFLLLPSSGPLLLLVGWTLVFEMYFYIVLSLGLLLPRVALPSILSVWALVILVAAPFSHGNPYAEFAFSPLNIEFLLGVVVGSLFVRGRLRGPGVAVMVGAVGILVLDACVLSGLEVYQVHTWVQVGTIGLAFALLVYGFVGLEAENRFVFHPGLVGLGNASYSLYLTHLATFKVLVLVLAAVGVAGHGMQVLSVPLAVGAAITGGLLYYALVEKPLLRVQRGRRAVADKVVMEPALPEAA